MTQGALGIAPDVRALLRWRGLARASTVHTENPGTSKPVPPGVTGFRLSGSFSNGFPEDELEKAFADHPGKRYRPQGPLDFTILKEGDKINAGDYSFRCIETPGHSPGHMCLYEDEKNILVSGDHILFDITPNITCWLDFKNALKSYLISLEKVSTLDVSLVLPGHRNLWNNHNLHTTNPWSLIPA